MYKQLYKELMTTAQLENRKKGNGIYYESHHIVPDFMFKNRKRTGPKGHFEGNPNASDNLVLLTFQEHLMAHYYLYEILKDTRYGYSAGAALQFFFINALGNHFRQKKLSDIDCKFLDKMAHLRNIGIESISKARKGKMPVVDSLTREKIGSVSISHPNVLSGKWIHHSKGKKQTWAPNDQRGVNNSNYKELTNERLHRLFTCLENAIVDTNYVSKKLLVTNIKTEFIEFKKISIKWVENHLGSIQNLVEKYNQTTFKKLIYSPYYRSIGQKNTLSIIQKNHVTVTNGKINKVINVTELNKFLELNTNYKQGRK